MEEITLETLGMRKISTLQKHASFGKAVLGMVKVNVASITGDDTIFELADLAVQHELIEYVPYDKKKHGPDMGELCDVEEGDMIYWWGAK